MGYATPNQVRYYINLVDASLADAFKTLADSGRYGPAEMTVIADAMDTAKAAARADAPTWSYATISSKLDVMIAAAAAREVKAAKDSGLADVPESRYRVGGVEYRVDRPTTGKWAGRVFVKDITAGDTWETSVRLQGADADAAMAAIKDFGALEAALEYGRFHGRCSCCHAKTSAKLTLQAGIGPDCAKRFGGQQAIIAHIEARAAAKANATS